MAIIPSVNGLSPVWCQAILWNSAELLPNGPLRTNLSEIWIKIQLSKLKKINFKMLQNGAHFV